MHILDVAVGKLERSFEFVQTCVGLLALHHSAHVKHVGLAQMREESRYILTLQLRFTKSNKSAHFEKEKLEHIL